MFTLSDVRANIEPGSNWSKWVIHPLSDRLLLVIANKTSLTPNHLTVLSFLIAIGAAIFFLLGNHIHLVIGGLFYQLSFALDAMDGTLARLKNLKSRLGAFIDPYFDIWKGILASIALIFGQYHKNGDVEIVFIETWFIFIFMAQPLFYEFIQKASGDKKDEIVKGVYDVLDRMQLKEKFHGKLLYPFTRVEFETIAFFIFPLLNQVKAGLLFSSLLGTINMLAINVVFIRSLVNYEKNRRADSGR